MKIAIIGDLDIVRGFKSLGVDVFGVSSKEEAKKALLEVYSNEIYALVLLMENWLIELKDEIKEFEQKSLPALMTIPSLNSEKSISKEVLSKVIERAIGSDMFS